MGCITNIVPITFFNDFFGKVYFELCRLLFFLCKWFRNNIFLDFRLAIDSSFKNLAYWFIIYRPLHWFAFTGILSMQVKPWFHVIFSVESFRRINSWYRLCIEAYDLFVGYFSEMFFINKLFIKKLCRQDLLSWLFLYQFRNICLFILFHLKIMLNKNVRIL